MEIGVIRRFSKCVFLLLLCPRIISLTVACAMPTNNGHKQEKVMISAEDIDRALENHSAELLAIPGVAGAARGICRNNPCLKIYVNREGPDLKKRLEGIIGGLPFEIEKSGPFQAL
jgi:hypothetical protein